jgi:DNA-directed RNA polymerase subunit RPC12/RpoP
METEEGHYFKGVRTMKRSAICYSCGKKFKVESETLKPGEPLLCPICGDYSYFNCTPEMEEPEKMVVK